MAVEAIIPIGDADAGAEDEGCVLLKHGGGIDDNRHRVHQEIVDELPALPGAPTVGVLLASLPRDILRLLIVGGESS